VGAVEDRLQKLGVTLPAPFAPPPGVEFKFDLVRVHEGLAYVSGHLPVDGDRVLVQGKVDADVSVEEAHQAARLTGLSILASLKQELGDLDRVTGWVKALGLVNCSPGFSKTPAVINGFSELILEVWGDAGHHSRSAIGAAELPFDVPVEVEAIAAVA
jgi:enamine deaminase RidA (YjgF/YER057c/UK114 family)